MTTVDGMRAALAVHGGRPVRDPARPWPRWPAPPPQAERNVLDVLYGDRWTLTAPIGVAELYERRFARLFAEYTGTPVCVPVDHGASALVVALEALGLEHGDRVLVPALTWTASATAALRAGLVPVLVDVDPVTGCVGPGNLDPATGARAVVAVHWACAMADVPAITSFAEQHGMVVVEDAAQAHGAEWRGRRAGSMGRLGCFSMQHGKVLAAGEGGAVVTTDGSLAATLEELRTDSRRFREDRGRPGEQDLVETGGVLGANFCMSEFHAAVLCAQLEVLDAQHEVRARNHALLVELVGDIPGVRLLRPPVEQTRLSIFELPVLLDALPPGMTTGDVAAALTAELGTPFYLTDTPLHRSPLLRPWTKPALAPLAREFAALHRDRSFPATDRLYERAVVTHHRTLLGGEQDMHDVAAALAKVAAMADAA